MNGLIYIVFGLILSSPALADLGSPNKKAWVRIERNGGKAIEAMAIVLGGGYEGPQKLGFLFLQKDGGKNSIWFNPALVEQRITFDWKILTGAKILGLPKGQSEAEWVVQERPLRKCGGPVETRIPLKDISSVTLHFKVTDSKRDALWKTFSQEESLKGCPRVSCHEGGDGDCIATFEPGADPVERVRNALSLYYGTISIDGWADPAHTPEELAYSPKMTPERFQKVRELIQQRQKFDHQRKKQPPGMESSLDQAYDELEGKIRGEMAPLLKLWQVQQHESFGFSEKEEWIYFPTKRDEEG